MENFKSITEKELFLVFVPHNYNNSGWHSSTVD